ncbi:hypothetical protein WKW80_33555 [Variovorax humicola]|uniref:Uncharacterized protein n=1 Tax=Variovorax humicola TaxID=1769758 RepID=A0ABU8WA82_9BURK
MPTEKERAWEAYQSRKRAYQSVYDNFRYTDAQREQVIEFIGAAMKVIRGDAKFESLKRLLPVARTRTESIDGQSYRGGTRFAFNSGFLNEWTSIYMLATTDAQGKVEPYHFQIYFKPPMQIPRERLEQLLRLKLVPGWTSEGGNLQRELPDPLHDLPAFDGGNFEYGLIDPPHAPYTVQVKFTYLNGPDHNPYTASRLARLELRREYLTSEQIRERDHQKLGHLSTTGQRVPLGGKWLGVCADDALTASMPMERRMCNYGEGHVFGPLWVWSNVARERVPVQAWWQWVAPDPFEEEIERIFGGKRKG